MCQEVIDAPFGQVLFKVSSQFPINVDTIVSSQTSEPILPDGQRVDGCLVSTLKCRLQAGDSAILVLQSKLNDGFKADIATGQYLDAMEIGGRTLSAAFGMRDAEWFYHLPALTSQPLPSNAEFKTQLSAESACEFEVEFAAAWTINPANEQEEVSPWFAIDLAMKS